MKIILITKYFNGNEIAARRWRNLIKYLKVDNCCVILTEISGEQPEDVNHGNLIFVKCFNKSHKFNNNNIFKKILKQLLKYLFPQVLLDLFRAQKNLKEMKRRVNIHQLNNADIMIASYGPIETILLGNSLKEELNIPYLIDFRDSFESTVGQQFFATKILSRILEKRIIKKANGYLTVGQSLAKYLSKIYGHKFYPIYSGWTESDDPPVLDRRAVGVVQNYIYYAGSIYSHRLESLKIVLDAIGTIPELSIRMRISDDYTSGGLDKLLSSVGDKNIFDRRPKVDKEKIRQEQVSAFAVVVLEALDTSSVHQFNITGKLFECLRAGPPVIVVAARHSELASLTSGVEGCYVVETVEEFRDAFRRVKQKPLESCISSDGSLRQFHAEVQSQKLKELINQVIG